MKTIGYVTNEFVTEKNFDGGLSRYVAKITKKMAEHNCQESVVIVCVNDFLKNNVALNYVDLGWCRVYRIPARKRWVEFIKKILKRLPFSESMYVFVDRVSRSVFAKRSIKRIIHKEKIDLIQYPSVGGLGLCRVKSVPSIVRISSHRLLWLKAQHEGRPTVAHFLEHFIEEFSVRRADSVMCPSIYLQSVFKKQGVVSDMIRTPLPEIPDNSDDDFYRTHLRRRKYILFFGALSRHKGCHIIADIMPHVFDEFSDVDIVFIGKDTPYRNEGMRSYVEKKLMDYNKRVHIFAPQRHESLIPVIEHAHIVLFPSLVENLSNALLEALTLGKIVVATDGVSFDEIIEDEVSGFLTDTKKKTCFLETVKKVLRLTETERKKVQKNAVLAVKKKVGECAVPQHAVLYERVVSEWKQQRRAGGT